MTLAIGYLTPADRFAQVVISDQAVAAVLRDRVPEAVRDGTAPVGTASWDRYRTTRDEPVLVGRVGRATVLVTGDAPVADLTLLARSVG